MSDRGPGPRRTHRQTDAERRASRAAVDDPEVVLAAALRFLEVRQRSIAEVRRRLARAGYREDLVEVVLARLAELGMLDDEAFARAWVESRDRAHPRGEHVLMLELRQKGIDATVIAASLRERREAAVRWESEPGRAEAQDQADPPPSADEAAARQLIARQARSLARIADPRARRQRAYALLARNGFGPEIAAIVSREVMADEDATEAEPAAD